MNPKYKIIILVSFIAIITVFFAARYLMYVTVYTPEDRSFRSQLQPYLKEQGDIVYLKQLVDFDWDEACIHSPYSSIFLYDNLRSGQYDSSWKILHEESWVIAFSKNNNPYKIIDIYTYFDEVQSKNLIQCGGKELYFRINNNKINGFHY